MAAEGDVIVVGGGAAGLFAAIRAARAGVRTLLLEKNRRPGVKILMSGGTRCNITNAKGAREVVEEIGPAARFLYPALAAMDPAAVVRFFEDAGVPTKVEDDVKPGKVFPVSDRATDVLDALLRRAAEARVEIATEAPARAIAALPAGRGFEVETPRGPVAGRRVVLAVGGASYPRSGTAGDGYAFARRFGHAVVEPLPALVPLAVAEPWVTALRGVAVARAGIATSIGGRPLERREGALLFTHFGLSGPVVLDASSALVRAARAAGWRGARAVLDFFPDLREEEVDARIREAARAAGGRAAKAALAGLPERLGAALVAEVARVPAHRRLAALSKEERRRLVRAAKAAEVAIVGDRGFAQAEVTSGGVALAEVDPRTLESRKQPGLHLAGEILDLHGPLGGYNFQIAWSTGWLAGAAAAGA